MRGTPASSPSGGWLSLSPWGPSVIQTNILPVNSAFKLKALALPQGGIHAYPSLPGETHALCVGGWLGLTHSTGSVVSEDLIVEQDQGRSEQDGTV